MKLNKRFAFLTPLLAAATLWCIHAGHVDPTAGFAMAAMPLFGIPCRRQDSNPDDNGGGGEAEFRKKVLGGIGEVKKQVSTIESKFTELDKESKQLSEDLSKHVKEFDGLPNQVADVMRTVQAIQLKVANERRSSYGTAAERISADPEMRAAVNGVIRLAAIKRGKDLKLTDDQKKGAEDFTRGMDTGNTPGSNYIDDRLVPEIYSLIAEFGVWRTFDVIPVSTKANKLIVDTTDPVMGFVDEGTAPSEASYAGTQVTATIKKVLGWIGISNELLEDSEVDLVRYLLPKFANAIANRIDHICLAANAAANSTDGGFTGIFQGGTLAAAAAGRLTVEATKLDDWLKPLLAVEAAALSRPCKWWIHPRHVVRALAVRDENGRPIFLPAIDAPAPGALGSILGYPVQLAHAAPSTNAASARVAAFGDPMGNAVTLRKDFEFASSDQVLFREDVTVFRGRARVANRVRQATAFGILGLPAA